MGLTELVNLSVLRIFRVIRLLRAGRLLIIVPELYILVSGLATSMKAIFFGAILLASVIFVWAIVTVELIHPVNVQITYDAKCPRCPRGFESVYTAAMTLFSQIVAGDNWGEMSLPLLESQPWTSVILFAIMMTISLGVMNLILAVIVEKATQSRQNDLEAKVRQKELERERNMIELALLCDRMDLDASGTLSMEEMILGYEQDRKICQIELAARYRGSRFSFGWVIAMGGEDDLASPLLGIEKEIERAIKLHLPVEAFIACSQTKRPDNTLFPDICSFNVGYSDLETYLPLILGMFEVSPEGEFTGPHIENVFKHLDREGDYNLSRARFKKDRRQWAANDPRLEGGYWRKALKRRTQTPVAQQLKAVLKHNPRRARESCRKSKPGALDPIMLSSDSEPERPIAQEWAQVGDLSAGSLPAAAASNGEGKPKCVDWTLRDAISFATSCPTKDDLVMNKPEDMTDDLWEEITVVFHLCKIHGTDPHLIHQKMIEFFEGRGEVVVPASKDTPSPSHKDDPVTPETTTPKTVAETEPDSTDSSVEKGLERRKAIEFLEQQDSQWDEEILERYMDKTGKEPNASQPPAQCVDSMQTIPWIDLDGPGDDMALVSKSPMSLPAEHLNLEPKPISEYEEAERGLPASARPSRSEAEIDMVAAAHPKDPLPDPLAKNFKCPKIIAVADSTMPDADVDAACRMLDEISLDVADAQPPVYAEQGQPRGRKPGKGSKLSKVKKAAKKNGKNGTKGAKKVKKVRKSGKVKAKKGSPVLADTEAPAASHDALEPTPNRKPRRSKKRASADACTPAPSVPCGEAAPVAPPKKRRTSSKKPAESVPGESQHVPTPARSMACTPAVEASAPEGNPPPRAAAPSCDVDDESIQKPADGIPAPAHCTTNTVYSNAYRRAKAATNSAEEAKKVP
eukprot:s261_g17.t2